MYIHTYEAKANDVVVLTRTHRQACTHVY